MLRINHNIKCTCFIQLTKNGTNMLITAGKNCTKILQKLLFKMQKLYSKIAKIFYLLI